MLIFHQPLYYLSNIILPLTVPLFFSASHQMQKYHCFIVSSVRPVQTRQRLSALYYSYPLISTSCIDVFKIELIVGNHTSWFRPCCIVATRGRNVGINQISYFVKINRQFTKFVRLILRGCLDNAIRCILVLKNCRIMASCSKRPDY